MQPQKFARTAEGPLEAATAHLQLNETDAAANEQVSGNAQQKKKRKNHRGGQRKKGKEKGKAQSLSDAVVVNTDTTDDNASTPSAVGNIDGIKIRF